MPVRTPLRTVTLLALTFLAACSPRFHADFEADSPGGPPALHPPGPADDEILIETSDVRGDGIVIRVTDEPNLVPPGAPHRFMSLIHEPNPGGSSHAWMLTDAMGTSRQPIFVQWEQVLDGGGTGVITFAALSDGPRIDGLCRVTTGNDVITIECGSSSEEIRGIDTHAIHSVFMRIDRWPQRRAVLWAVQEASSTPLATIASGDVPAPVEGQRFVAQIEHHGQSDTAYRFNRFDVQERDPD
jgi:hypothetical protein